MGEELKIGVDVGLVFEGGTGFKFAQFLAFGKLAGQPAKKASFGGLVVQPSGVENFGERGSIVFVMENVDDEVGLGVGQLF